MKKITNDEIKKFFPEKTKLIRKCLKEYENYNQYLTKDFFYEEYDNFKNSYSYECGISPEIIFKMFIKNKVLKKLSEYIRNGDIDLEIELIDKYTPLTNSILSKMNITGLDLKINIEDILIKSLETYDGNKSFSLYIVENIRKITKDNLEKINDLETKNEKNKKLSFEQLIEEYVSQSQISSFTPNDIDYLVKKFNIIDYVDNDKLKKYVFLRFGYYNNIYFNNIEIEKIMSISKEDGLVMYKEILNILKSILNEKINLVISNDFYKDKQYLKSNK